LNASNAANLTQQPANNAMPTRSNPGPGAKNPEIIRSKAFRTNISQHQRTERFWSKLPKKPASHFLSAPALVL
jgi:hypothetical protein